MVHLYTRATRRILFVFGFLVVNVHVESQLCFLTHAPGYLSIQVIANTFSFVQSLFPSSYFFSRSFLLLYVLPQVVLTLDKIFQQLPEIRIFIDIRNRSF